MRHFHIILFTGLILVTAPALADSPYKGGMKYTTFGASGAIKSKNQEDAAIKERTLSPAEPAHFEKEEKSAPISKIWTKYRDLAAGTTTKPDDAHEEKSTEETHQAAVGKAPKEQKTKTGFAAILEQYQQNKTNQGRMNTIDVPRPKRPEKPSVD